MRGRTLDLTFKEFELLKFLAQHPGRVFTRAVLLQEVWGYDYFGGTRTVDVHVRRLRAKLGPEHEALIGTVRNVGYRFVPERADPQTMATLDEIPVDEVKDFQEKMEEFLTTRKESVLAKVRDEKALTDEVVADLKSAFDDFKATYNAG